MSNKKYRWHSSEGSCEKCQALNNTEYDSEKEIPDKPHPNCKCYVEVVEDNSICDCIKDFLAQMGELDAEAKFLANEIKKERNNFVKLLVTRNLGTKDYSLIENYIDAIDQLFGTISDFINNYKKMVEVQKDGADKYYHSKSNCEGAQRGEYGKIVAKVISDLREFTDLYKNITVKRMTIEATLRDKKEDDEANVYGREQGEKYPTWDSRVLVDIYRPDTLPAGY